jgi:hypothetical protein
MPSHVTPDLLSALAAAVIRASTSMTDLRDVDENGPGRGDVLTSVETEPVRRAWRVVLAEVDASVRLDGDDVGDVPKGR